MNRIISFPAPRWYLVPQTLFILRIMLLLASTASSTAKLKHFISAQWLQQSQKQKQLLSRGGLKANISVSWDVPALVLKKIKIQILFWAKLWCLHLGSGPLVKCPLRQSLKAKKSLKNLALQAVHLWTVMEFSYHLNI